MFGCLQNNKYVSLTGHIINQAERTYEISAWINIKKQKKKKQQKHSCSFTVKKYCWFNLKSK